MITSTETETFLRMITDLTINHEMPFWLTEIDLNRFSTNLTKLELFAIERFIDKSLQGVFFDYDLRFDYWTQKQNPSFEAINKKDVILLITKDQINH